MPNRIKELRESRGVLQKELADLVGVSINTVRRWESGEREPRSRDVLALANVFGKSAGYVMGQSGDSFDKLQSDHLVKSEMINVPVLSREWTACCGNGIPALDITNPPDEYIPWPRDDFRALDDMRPPFAIYVEGDCLESIDIRDGDKVIINPAEEPSQGTVALTRRHGVLALRYVYRLKNGDIVLRCDTGSTAMSPTQQEESDFAILGALVGTFHPRPPALPL